MVFSDVLVVVIFCYSCGKKLGSYRLVERIKDVYVIWVAGTEREG